MISIARREVAPRLSQCHWDVSEADPAELTVQEANCRGTAMNQRSIASSIRQTFHAPPRFDVK